MSTEDENVFFYDVITSFDFIKFLLNEKRSVKSLPAGTNLNLKLLKTGNILFPNVYVSISTLNKEEIDVLTDIYANSDLFGIVSMNPNTKSIYNIGVTAQILKIVKISDDKVQLFLQGIDRFKILKSDDTNNGIFSGDVEIISDEEVDESSLKCKAIEDVIKESLPKLVEYQSIPVEVKFFIEQSNDLNILIYLIASSVNFKNSDKQKLLEELNIIRRGELLVKLLKKEIEFGELKKKVLAKAQDSINRRQKEFFIKQQIDALKDELDSNTSMDYDDDIDKLKAIVSRKKFNKDTKEFVNKLIKKAEKSIQNTVDYMILLNQIEFILDLPWNNYSSGDIDITKVKELLDKNHYGMTKIKDRVLEYLSVYKLSRTIPSGNILCLLGPPGVGKTSLCRSIANALQREYVKVSLGGIDDEAEIRGHRKTYIGAMAGRILKGLQNLKTSNPVFVLDEIDKMTRSQGDPSAALLEVLDPDQNTEFVDHYVEAPYNLSKVLFIATANDYSSIPYALRDRLEIIDVSGYALEEKLQIAKQYLIPELIDECGLKSADVSVTDKCVEKIIDNYTRESGVRELRRQLSELFRKICLKIVKEEKYDNVIDSDILEKYLGVIKYDRDYVKELNKPGVAIGLAWTPVGGDILFLEAVKMKGSGKLTLSGKLGDVIKESANLAFVYLKSHANEFNIDSSLFDTNDFHIHFPDGATPKDGPSAGITIFSSLYSLLIDRKIRSKLAMTGEITLRGEVTEVGGIREKVLAAKRSGIDTIIMCKGNKKDVSEIEKDFISGINFIYISDISELPNYIF